MPFNGGFCGWLAGWLARLRNSREKHYTLLPCTLFHPHTSLANNLHTHSDASRKLQVATFETLNASCTICRKCLASNRPLPHARFISKDATAGVVFRGYLGLSMASNCTGFLPDESPLRAAGLLCVFVFVFAFGYIY